MFQNSYRLLTFVDAAEKIYGRKKLQKMIHLLKSAGTSFPFLFDIAIIITDRIHPSCNQR